MDLIVRSVKPTRKKERAKVLELGRVDMDAAIELAVVFFLLYAENDPCAEDLRAFEDKARILLLFGEFAAFGMDHQKQFTSFKALKAS
jgi:hypothetical protein